MWDFTGGETDMDDDRHLVIDCPVCHMTIWSGMRCPGCAKRRLLDTPVVGGPVVDEPAKVIGHYQPKTRDKRRGT